MSDPTGTIRFREDESKPWRLFARGPKGDLGPGGGGGLVAVDSSLLTTSVVIDSTNWTNLDTGTDLIIPASVGDLIEVSVSGFWASQALQGYLDAVSVVSGSPVNSWATQGAVAAGSVGVLGWTGGISMQAAVGPSVFKEIVAGDIDSGNVTIRFRTRTSSASNKTFFAATDSPAIFQAKNLGPKP